MWKVYAVIPKSLKINEQMAKTPQTTATHEQHVRETTLRAPLLESFYKHKWLSSWLTLICLCLWLPLHAFLLGLPVTGHISWKEAISMPYGCCTGMTHRISKPTWGSKAKLDLVSFIYNNEIVQLEDVKGKASHPELVHSWCRQLISLYSFLL